MSGATGIVCNEHGEGVQVCFPVAYGPGGCPMCEMKRQMELLEDEWEPYDEAM